jgi:hypothetical protein
MRTISPCGGLTERLQIRADALAQWEHPGLPKHRWSCALMYRITGHYPVDASADRCRRASNNLVWVMGRLADALLNTPVEFEALPQDRHLPFAAEGLVLAVARDVGVCSRGKRLDDDTVQHRADGGAPTVGIP